MAGTATLLQPFRGVSYECYSLYGSVTYEHYTADTFSVSCNVYNSTDCTAVSLTTVIGIAYYVTAGITWYYYNITAVLFGKMSMALNGLNHLIVQTLIIIKSEKRPQKKNSRHSRCYAVAYNVTTVQTCVGSPRTWQAGLFRSSINEAY